MKVYTWANKQSNMEVDHLLNDLHLFSLGIETFHFNFPPKFEFLQHIKIPLGVGAEISFVLEAPSSGTRVRAHHTSKIVVLGDERSDALSLQDAADGMCTGFVAPLDPNTVDIGDKPPYFPFLMTTADCLAVAFCFECSAGNRFYALVHAGWRGFFGNIIFKTIEIFKKQIEVWGFDVEASMRALHVFISPSIFGSSYPCGFDVAMAAQLHLNFMIQNVTLSEFAEQALRQGYEQAMRPWLLKDKVLPDLQKCAILDLLAMGVSSKNLSVFRDNTFGHPVFPSYRFATLEAQKRGEQLESKKRARRFWTKLSLN